MIEFIRVVISTTWDIKRCDPIAFNARQITSIRPYEAKGVTAIVLSNGLEYLVDQEYTSVVRVINTYFNRGQD